MLSINDKIYTPRFCTVKIKEIFQSSDEARNAGYTEPTHFHDAGYGIYGKSIGLNQMEFAAFRERETE